MFKRFMSYIEKGIFVLIPLYISLFIVKVSSSFENVIIMLIILFIMLFMFVSYDIIRLLKDLRNDNSGKMVVLPAKEKKDDN